MSEAPVEAADEARAEVRCSFIKSSGQQCKQRFVPTEPWDPDLPLCVFHRGWSSISIERKRGLLKRSPADISKVSPMAAMLEEIDRTQVMIAWYEAIIADMDPDQLMQATTFENRIGGPGGDYQLARAEQRPHPALVLLNDERRHLANITRLALQSGIEEKQLALNTQLAQGLITAMQNFARLASLDPLSPMIKSWMAQAMRTARTGEVIDVTAESARAAQQELPPAGEG